MEKNALQLVVAAEQASQEVTEEDEEEVGGLHVVQRQGRDGRRLLQVHILSCCCLPCYHRSKWTFFVEDILTLGHMLRSTHYREFLLDTMQTRLLC